MPARRLAPAVAALASLLPLAACGDSPGGASRRDPTTAIDAASDASIADAAPAVPSAYDVHATLVGGGDFDLATYSGRPVVLWFWAPY